MGDRLPRAVEISEVVAETPRIRTLRFSDSFSFTPGQFVMVWVPGVDEIPMALSSSRSISVLAVGDATRALCAMRAGDRIGIRGPFGNGFQVQGQTLAIAGGIGAAPLLPLAQGGKVGAFLLGAATAQELPFQATLSGATTLHVATDDGSAGHHGVVTRLLDELVLEVYDHFCVCGPEPMMLRVLDILAEKDLEGRGQFSLHRYMKCGIGICGSCCIDPSGQRACRDGPVFTGDHLLDSELGRYARDGSGTRRRFG
jgi:dihydroorotate dehydrogenase electron transfer subunit